MKKFKLSNWLKKLPEHYIIKNLSINKNSDGIINIEIFVNEELKQLLSVKKSFSNKD
tara:strand:+ start:295 stop:465 length:171 start_codon:yes stop_codon:yes gene_type:complete